MMIYSNEVVSLVICSSLLLLLKILEWNRPALMGVTRILSYIVVFISLLVYLALPRKENALNPISMLYKRIELLFAGKEKRKPKIYELKSIQSFIDELNILISSNEEHLNLLKALQSNINTKKFSIQEMVESGVIQRILVAISTMQADDQRLSLSFDILNENFNSPEFSNLINRNDESNHIVDIVLELSKATRYINEGFSMDSFIDLDDVSSSTQDNIISISDEEAKIIAKKKGRMLVLEHGGANKAIMSIGLLASISVNAQGLLGDHGAIDTIINCSINCKESHKISKWCLWAMIHLCFKHPPNKRDYFVKNGIPATLSILKHHQDTIEVVHQGFALLYCVLSDETKSKYNLHTARSQALAHGLIDEVYHAQKAFIKNRELMSTIQAIQGEIFKDWS